MIPYFSSSEMNMNFDSNGNLKVVVSGFNVSIVNGLPVSAGTGGNTLTQLSFQDSNGVVELVISTKDRMLGVGWHPERIINTHTREYIYSLIRKL